MLEYQNGKGEWKNWIISDNDFNTRYFGKTEAIMALGNGYLGLRSVHEEDYFQQTRNLFVSGTFNKASIEEVSELPNLPDLTNMNFWIDGKRFTLETGTITDYSKTLNMKTGELRRSFTWVNPEGKSLDFSFQRFVSANDLHVMGMKITIKMNADLKLSMQSGINGQLTNSGAMHLTEGIKRVYDDEILHYQTSTIESQISFWLNTVHRITLNNQVSGFTTRKDIDRRKISMNCEGSFHAGDTLVIEKLSTVHTSRDLESAGNSSEGMLQSSLEAIRSLKTNGYEQFFRKSVESWKQYWNEVSILIDSKDEYDQLAIRFAQYHLKVMTPAHDARMGIGAKGLSGEGYKGHSFWDTELFILPYYYTTLPEVAKSLLIYRYHGLKGARAKAKEYGYEGAMYPWEAAWIDDGEVTPIWGGIDIVSGEATKIWSGFIEQHITSDIVYAIWSYYRMTGDREFMECYGYEIIFETAIFWSSRFEWNKNEKRYEIRNVIGPDEYKEHIDNNAFTNYMAKFNIDLALTYYDSMAREKPVLLKKLEGITGFGSRVDQITERVAKLYLPVPNEDGVLPQDDTYLSKEVIDLRAYKAQENVGSLFLDYNLEQVNEIQISKQADVMILFYLLESIFSKTIKIANWNYYEPKTLHDSSLSLSTHSIIASDIHDYERAYQLYRQATAIDLGPNMKTSDHGIHAASLGGIWQCVVNGFAGIRLVENHLRIEPNLPKNWRSLQVPVVFKGVKTVVRVLEDKLELQIEDGKSIVVEHNGEIQELRGQVILSN